LSGCPDRSPGCSGRSPGWCSYRLLECSGGSPECLGRSPGGCSECSGRSPGGCSGRSSGWRSLARTEVWPANLPGSRRSSKAFGSNCRWSTPACPDFHR
jgi:hypothetical protein